MGQTLYTSIPEGMGNGDNCWELDVAVLQKGQRG